MNGQNGQDQQDQVPMVLQAEVIPDQSLAQLMCACCEPPKRLLVPSSKDVPFAFCPGEGGVATVYEKVGDGYQRTEYELRENSVIDPKDGRIVFPRADQEAAPSQERLRRETPEEAGGPKPQRGVRVNLGEEEYY